MVMDAASVNVIRDVEYARRPTPFPPNQLVEGRAFFSWDLLGLDERAPCRRTTITGIVSVQACHDLAVARQSAQAIQIGIVLDPVAESMPR